MKISKKVIGIIAVSIFIIILIIGAMAAYQAYLFANAGNFQTYEPKVLPLKQKIATKALEIWHTGGTHSNPTPFFSHATITLKLVPLDGHISESKLKAPTSLKCDRVDNIICNIRETPKGIRYVHSIARNQLDEPWYEKITFHLGSTAIVFYIETRSQKNIPKEEWNNSIDSFMPEKFKDLSIKHFVPGP